MQDFFSKSTLFEIAKKYVSGEILGRPVSVFPVKIQWNPTEKKYDKKPLIAWKELQNRLPTEQELKQPKTKRHRYGYRKSIRNYCT